jgi:hypothetical protein
MYVRGTFLARITLTSLQTILAADVRLTERQLSHGEQTMNKSKRLIYRAGTGRPTVSKTELQRSELN